MNKIYSNFQNYSFRYDPESFTFTGYWHNFNDEKERLFLSGKILQSKGLAFPAGTEQKSDVQWTMDSKRHVISGKTSSGEDLFEFAFTFTKNGMTFSSSANVMIEGLFHWGEKVTDVLPGVYSRTTPVLQASSGPAVREGDDLLFDRKHDRALHMTPRGCFKMTFDWEKMAYAFKFSHNASSSDNGLLFQIEENFVAQNMSMRYKPINKSGWFSTAPVGWMTWYATRFDACEKEVLENTAKLKETFGKYTDKLVSWVDWEWYHKNIKGDGEGDGNIFSPCKDTYPNGLKYVCDKIKEMDVLPALWVGPTCEGNKNSWFEAHPDCVIGPYPFWCGQWWVNPDKPEVYNEYIPLVMKQVLDWGYKIVKWDCQTMTSYVWEDHWEELGSPELSVDQLEHRIIAAGRKALGDEVYLLLCNPVAEHDISVGSDLCDAARIGADIFKWDEFIEHAIDRLFYFYPIHNTVLYADCDNIVIRNEYNNLAQARTRVSFYGLSGVPVTLGDRFCEYDPERIHMLSRIIPVVDMHPVEFNSKKPEGVLRKFLANFSRSFGSWQVMSITNTDKENTIGCTIDFAGDCSLETASGKRYALYDFWNSRFLGVFEKGATVEVPPLDTAVLRITPIEDDVLPTLVSSSRHITQGGHELLALARREKTVSGTTLCVAGEPCRLTFFVPAGMTVTAVGGTWSQEGSCGVLTLENAAGGESSWRLEVQ